MLFFITSWIGLLPIHMRLVKLWLPRIARNVNRFVAAAGSGDGAFMNSAWSANTRWIPAAVLNRLLQYVWPLPLSEPAALMAGWSTPARYRLVFDVLCIGLLALTIVIGSFSGTRATGDFWSTAACNSLSGSEVPGWLSLDCSGFVQPTQPSAGSMNASISRLSLALNRSTVCCPWKA